MGKKVRIVTHSGTFHLDELLGVAALELYLDGKPYEVVRTRDPKVWQTGDFVIDVGRIYDSATNRFDHHQEGGAGARENGIPYSSFGLVWRHYGEAITGSREIATAIDERIGHPVDMGDNGHDYYTKIRPDTNPLILQFVIAAFRPTWKSSVSHDDRFLELIPFLRRFLELEIAVEHDKLDGKHLVEEAYQRAKDKRIIILDGPYPWHETLGGYTEPLYVVKPKNQNSDWEVECVRDDMASFINRKSLPVAWAGKTDGELAAITGVSDAVFCHNMRYIVVTHTKEGACRLAQMALDA